MATKTAITPSMTLAFFQHVTNKIEEHYDDSAHEDGDGNMPCEDSYCKLEEGNAIVIKAMFDALKPLLWDYVDEFDFSEHDSFSDLRRARKHQHECGQRMTGRAVVVEGA